MNNRQNSYSRFLVFILLFLLLMTSRVSLFAQTDPEDTAVPYPIVTPQPTLNHGYPENTQIIPPTTEADFPTAYPIFTATPADTTITIPVVGDDLQLLQTAVPSAKPTPSTRDVIQSNLVLWLGFLIGFLILGTGIYGAILLYTRK